MRVGLVSFGSLETLTGGNLYDSHLVEYLRRCGDDVQILIIPIQSYSQGLLDNFNTGLYRRLVECDVDILLQDEVNHPSLFLLNRRIKARVGYPIVSIVHHLRASEAHPASLVPLYKTVEGSYLRSLDGLVYASRATSRAAHRLAHIPQPGIIARPAGFQFSTQITEPDVISRAHAPGPLRILFVGNLIRRKHVHDLLAALAGLPASEFILEIVGSRELDPGYAHVLEDMVSRWNLSSRVHFRGHLPPEQLGQAYRTSQVLAVSSQYEGFGIVYLEGLQFGLPALASSDGGAGEVISPGENGFLVEPGDVEGIRDHLMGWAKDRDMLAHMSQAALRSYARFPTWQETGERIREFLEGITRERDIRPYHTK